MIGVETTRLFTVGVFQDVAWAVKGLDALIGAGFPPESLTIIAKEGADISTLVERTFGSAGERLDVAGIGANLASWSQSHGRLAFTLSDSTGADIWTMKVGDTAPSRVTRIFETLTGRGGVLVAIRTEPRAADALAILHSYGGGNAAIGAWTGKV